MYCNRCGTKLIGNELFCTNCGEKINNNISYNNGDESTSKNSKDGNKTASVVLGIISIVGAILFIFAPITFILGIIGLILAIGANKDGNNVSGIVLNAIGLVLSFAMSILFLLMMNIVVTAVDDAINEELNKTEYQDYNYYDDNDYNSIFDDYASDF